MNTENIYKAHKLISKLFEHEKTISKCDKMEVPAEEGFLLFIEGCEKIWISDVGLRFEILDLVKDTEREKINSIKQELATL